MMNNEEEEIRCLTMWQLKQGKSYNEIVDHVLTGCLECITNPKKQFNGHEMLFPDTPPPWIKIPEAEISNPHSWTKYQKRRVHTQMTPEEFEQFLIDSDLGDEAICHEIAKFRRVERVQAWPYMREIRKKQKEIRMEKEKEQREFKKREMEGKKESERIKKMDEKRKYQEKKLQKDEEKQDFLDKIEEQEKLLDEGLGNVLISGTSSEKIPGPQNSAENPDQKNAENNTEESMEIRKNFKSSFNLKAQMPWSPSPYDMLCSELRSIIDHQQQKRIIAMCQNLMYFGELQHMSNKRELKDIRQAAESEYDTLVAAALEHARNEACHPIDFVTEKTMLQCLNSFRRREPRGDNLQYMFKDHILTLENVEAAEGIRSETQAMMPKVEKILKNAKWRNELTLPDVTKKCQVVNNQRLLPTKTKLNDDPIASSLISTCPTVTVMADATTICHMLTTNWESRDYEYAIPIEVKEERIDGVMKKIVVLSKPMPSGMISKSSIQRKTLKRMLKSQFLKQTCINKPEKSMENSELPPENTEKPVEDIATTSSPNNLIDDIIAEMSCETAISSSKTSKSLGKSVKTDESHGDCNAYQYAVFRVGEARFLCRSNSPYTINEPGEKKHSFLENVQKITFEPRIEYLPNGGAMDLGVAEWVWNYTKALLKMSNFHVLYRTSYRLDHILQLDAITMKPDMHNSPPGAFGLLSARSLMLEKFIFQLESLPIGEYIGCQENGKPLIVVPKCTSSDQRGGVSIAAMRITENDIRKASETIGDDYFHGFSPNVAFQWQIVQGRAPLLLLAKDSPLARNLPSKKNKVKVQQRKTQIKRKFKEREAIQEAAKRHKTLDLDDPNLNADFTNPSFVNVKFAEKTPKFFENRGQFRGKRGSRGNGGRRGRGGGGFRGNKVYKGERGESKVADIP